MRLSLLSQSEIRHAVARFYFRFLRRPKSRRPTSDSDAQVILRATPSAAGPRPLLIALGLQFLGIAASGSWHSWYPKLSFERLEGFSLASWGTLGDLGTLGSMTKETLRSRPVFLTFFCRFRDAMLRVFRVPRTKNSAFVHACFQVVLSYDFWVGSGCLGLQNRALGKGDIAKNSFQRKLEF